MNSIHSKYGGSTAARTVNCPGWQRQSEGVPRETGGPSPFAQEGTALHDIMEAMLLYDGVIIEDFARSFIGKVMHDTEITEDHIIERILPAWEAWEDLVKKYRLVEFEPEVKCTYQDDIGGYADVIACDEHMSIVAVADWKFGRGIQVDAEESHQGRFYAMASRASSSADDMFTNNQKVVCVIIQPNDQGLPVLRTWETDTDGIDAYQDEFMDAYDRAEGEDPELHAGGHCKFCPAAPMCPEKTGLARLALMMQPDDLESLTQNMNMVSQLKAWISEVETAVYDQLEVGAPVKGWKLVAKIARAKWNDETQALKSLARKLGGKGKITDAKLKSPAQIKKVAKAQGVDITWHLEHFEVKKSSGSTLAPEDDKRPAVLNTEGLQAALNAIT